MRISDWSSDVCSSDLADLLADAGDATYDILAEKGHLDDIAVDAVQQELRRAGERRKVAGISHFQRLRTLVHAPVGDDHDTEVTEIVAEMEIDREQIGRAHVCTPVTNAPLVCRLMLEK